MVAWVLPHRPIRALPGRWVLRRLPSDILEDMSAWPGNSNLALRHGVSICQKAAFAFDLKRRSPCSIPRPASAPSTPVAHGGRSQDIHQWRPAERRLPLRSTSSPHPIISAQVANQSIQFAAQLIITITKIGTHHARDHIDLSTTARSAAR